LLKNVNIRVRSEIIMAYYVCKLNLSFNLAAKLPSMIRQFAPDSDIMIKVDPSRKKL
jgi:hypothetical protein